MTSRSNQIVHNLRIMKSRVLNNLSPPKPSLQTRLLLLPFLNPTLKQRSVPQPPTLTSTEQSLFKRAKSAWSEIHKPPQQLSSQTPKFKGNNSPPKKVILLYKWLPTPSLNPLNSSAKCPKPIENNLRSLWSQFRWKLHGALATQIETLMKEEIKLEMNLSISTKYRTSLLRTIWKNLKNSKRYIRVLGGTIQEIEINQCLNKERRKFLLLR